MMPALRVHLITLGVDDVARSARFYEALGMQRRLKASEGVAFFDAGGAVVSIYDRAALAKDSGTGELPRGSGSAALAFNVTSEGAVDEMLNSAAKAGGKILKPGYRVFWGGYIGYFADPDGHIWEVAHNADFKFDERGLLVLPD
jgi:predicted lactoylglutathione lyase